jgi:hypothetical protein
VRTPAGFTTWTVCDNRPLADLAPNLKYVTGFMPRKTERKMLVARRGDGGLVVFNAIALTESEMQQLEAFGKLAWLVVPNRFHRQDALIWKQRYPGLRVVAPKAAVDAVRKAVAVDLTCDEVPADVDVALQHVPVFAASEAMLRVRHDGAGDTAVFCDALLNMCRMRCRSSSGRCWHRWGRSPRPTSSAG